MPCLLVSVIYMVLTYNGVFGGNILFFHTIATSSHRTAIWPLAEKLADVGHNVTYIFPMITKRVGSHPKVKEIVPSKMVPINQFISDFDINFRLNNTVDQWLQQVFSKAVDLCEAFYDSTEVQDWLSQPDLNYDLIFIDASLGECAFGLVHFRAKHILFSPLVIPFHFDGFGIVPESSSIPELFLSHAKPTEMTFWNRVYSTLLPLMWRYNYVEFSKVVEPVIKKKLNFTHFPPISEFERNTSLLFVNSHFVEEYPLSLPPMFVSYSGLWCSKEMKRKPLPQDISTFIGDSDGFIYISLGSAVRASALPVALRNEFFKTFKSLPHLKFLWRWTGEVPENTPKNALLLNWFPQHDILAHPKIKGFVTQTGRPSTQEALCHGVPLITIPIFGDQDYNADRLEYIGAAIKLDISNISASSLTNSIRGLLEDPRHKNKMIEMSEIFKDRPLDPLQNALYWTEYVLRHDTSLLKPLGINQTWWQRRLLDVYAFLLLTALTIIIGLMLLAFVLTKFILSFMQSVSLKKKTD